MARGGTILTYEILTMFFIGLVVGALLNRSKDSSEQQKLYEIRYREYQNNIEYYKRLTSKLVEENTQLRKQHDK